MSEKKKETMVELQPLNIQEMDVPIIGITSLLMNKGAERIAMELESKRNKKVKVNAPIDARTSDEKFEDKIHYLSDGKGIGFPAYGFKAAMTEVVTSFGDLKRVNKKTVRSIQIMIDSGDLVPITFEKQTINTTTGHDSGRNKAPIMIVRPEFIGWGCILHLRFNASVFTPEDIVNLLNLAGFQNGIGAWCPFRGGSHGMFKVKT